MRKNSKQLDLYLEFDSPVGLGSFISLAKESSLEISDIQIIKNKTTGKKVTSVLLSVKSKQNQSHADVLQRLGCVDGLNCIEEV